MSLTKSDLQAIKKIVGDEVHNQLSEYHANMAEPEFHALNQRIDNLENKVGDLDDKVGDLDDKVGDLDDKVGDLDDKVDDNHRWLKDEIDGLKAGFSQQVSKKEFNLLKAKVDRYHPSA